MYDEEVNINRIYDRIDVQNAFSTGFWIGCISAGSIVFLSCLLVGIYLT